MGLVINPINPGLCPKHRTPIKAIKPNSFGLNQNDLPAPLGVQEQAVHELIANLRVGWHSFIRCPFVDRTLTKPGNLRLGVVTKNINPGFSAGADRAEDKVAKFFVQDYAATESLQGHGTRGSAVC